MDYYALRNRLADSNKKFKRHHTVVGHQAGAAGGFTMARTQNKRKPYRKTGSKRKTKGSYRGSSFSAKYAQPLVHRNVLRAPAVPWTLAGAPNVGLYGSMVFTPDVTWGRYGRGFDINQVTSMGIRSRNCTIDLRVQFPKAGTAPQPFQFRVIQCWIKCPVVGATLHTSAATTGRFDGLVYNFDPSTVWDNHARQVVIDSVGVVNGAGNPGGNINGDRMRVVSDRRMNITASQVTAAGKYVFPSYSRVFNFKTQKNMRLYATTAGPGEPADPLDINLCPVNNANLWIPCVVLSIINGADYQGQDDIPTVTCTQSHYWTDL